MKKRLKELAEMVGGEVLGNGEIEIIGANSIEGAKAGEITFVAHPKYFGKLKETKASAVIVSKDVKEAPIPLLSVENPLLAFTKILTLFSLKAYQPRGIDPGAWISPSAHLGKDLSIYPFVYIGDRCEIGDRVTLFPGVYIGEDSVIGEDSILYPNVALYPRSIIGRRVILHSGVVIGADGFGYVKEGTRNLKIPQLGRVIIEDEVELGANTTVDRATFGETIIRKGVKIDNLVQIAHNVEIGEDSLIVAQVGIAGSTRIGKNVILAGQVGVVDHVEIGDNVRVGAQSGVPYDLAPNRGYTGSPALPHQEFLRAITTFPKLPEMRKNLLDFEKRLRKLEELIYSKEKEKKDDRD